MYNFFQSLAQKILNGIIYVAHWFGNLFSNIWSAFKYFIAEIFKPIILFFQGVFYLLEKVFDIVVLVIQVIFGLFKVVWGVVSGIFHTFSTLLSYSGSTGYYHLPSAYRHGWESVTGFFGQTGFNTLALVLLVFVWIVTAYAVIKIAGSER